VFIHSIAPYIGPLHQNVVTVPGINGVVAETAIERVITVAAVDQVIAGVTVDYIAAVARQGFRWALQTVPLPA
jgi:hypothetical protein